LLLVGSLGLNLLDNVAASSRRAACWSGPDDPGELARVRKRLVGFAAGVFEPLARADQRRWGECYLRGLMLDGKRKSIQPMPQRLPDGNEQALQQFVSQSPWDWRPVRQRLAQQMTAAVDPDAWIIDDTGFPKFGNASVGVARQYSGTLGKVANCQVGGSIHAATDQASCPIDWRLFLPESWDQDAERRRAAHLPEQVRHRPRWQLVLDMVDELAVWGLAPPAVAADAGYGESGELRLGLEARGLAYVVQVKATTSAYPEAVSQQVAPYVGRGRRPRAGYRARRSWLAELVMAAGPSAAKTLAWREGTRGKLRSRFAALRVRPAGVKLRRAAAGGELPVRWLLAQWPADQPEPVKYWLASLPQDTPLVELVRLAKLRWRIEHDHRELKDGLGLDHFEAVASAAGTTT
jgi:SRSO17 transposase